MTLSKSDLEAQNESNLLNMLSNSAVKHEVKLYAAVLLYKRGSRFLAFEDWQKYKNEVLDYLLQEQASIPPRPFAPNVSADLAGRLHTRLADANQAVDQAHDRISEANDTITRVSSYHKNALADEESRRDDQANKYREEFLKGLADHDNMLSGLGYRVKDVNEESITRDRRLESMIQILDTKLEVQVTDRFKAAYNEEQQYRSQIKKQVKNLKIVLACSGPAIILVSYLIHHFLR